MNKDSVIEVWSQPSCVACTQVKSFLDTKGYSYVEYVLGENATKQALFEKLPSVRSVPQIFIDGNYIGGANETIAYLLANPIP